MYERLLNVHIAQRKDLLERVVHQKGMRMGNEEGLAASPILPGVVPENVEILAVLRAADVGPQRGVRGDAEDVIDGLLDLLVLAELRGMRGEQAGGDHPAALIRRTP